MESLVAKRLVYSQIPRPRYLLSKQEDPSKLYCYSCCVPAHPTGQILY